MVDLFRRINYRHFKQDVYPTREKVEQILQEAINISPVDKEYFSWRFEIHGPEYAADKAELVLESGTNGSRDDDGNIVANYLGYTQTHGFDKWYEQVKKSYAREPGSFNCQIQAPYLISVIAEDDPDDHEGYIPERRHHSLQKYRHYMNMGIFIHGLALTANSHEIDLSYCKCYSNHRDNPMLRVEGDHIITLMGLGYYDWSLAGTEGYTAHFEKTDNPDVVARVKGGTYNIKDCTRESGFKHKKPSIDQMLTWK